MSFQRFHKSYLCRVCIMLAAAFFANALAVAGEEGRSVFVLTSTNSASGNDVVVFKLDTAGTPSLSLVNTLPTGGKGGAGNNAGILQFKDDLGAVANYGSNSVSQLVRYDDFISIGETINLAHGCVKPDSVALTEEHLFVVGTNCAESHAWPSGQCGWSRRRSQRSFGCADSGRQELGGCHTDVRIRPSAASHAAGDAQRGECHRNAPQHGE